MADTEPFLDSNYFNLKNKKHIIFKCKLLNISLTISILLSCIILYNQTQTQSQKYELSNFLFDYFEISSDPYSMKVKENIHTILQNYTVMSSPIPPFQKMSKSQYSIVPAHRLGHCRILKSMSTVLTNILCYLYDTEEFLQQNKSISTGLWEDRICESRNYVDSFEELKKRLPFGFNMLVMVRDPLSRFVSGYLDQCLKVKNCLNCNPKNLHCVLTNLRQTLRERATNGIEGYPYSHPLVHLSPQTWYCNMSMVYETATFLKYKSGKEKVEMIDDLLSTLSQMKVPMSKILYIRHELMRKEKTAHATEEMDIQPKINFEIRNNSTLLSIFLDIFKYDYEIFGYPLPTEN